MGYNNVHKYLNTLIFQTNRDHHPWIYPWQDDIQMMTNHWDEKILSRYDKDKIVIPFHTVSGRGGGREIAYFFNSILFDATDVLLFHAATDAALREISKKSGIFRKDKEISILHRTPNDDVLQAGRASIEQKGHEFNQLVALAVSKINAFKSEVRKRL